MPGRIVRTTHFERLLAGPALVRSPHFSASYLRTLPPAAAGTKLSTARQDDYPQAVDDTPTPADLQRRLGAIVPKRLAREATTRNLIRRQVRESFRAHEMRLGAGWWLLRLRHGFDRRQFRSPTSTALRQAARAELDELLRRAAQRSRGGASPT